MDKGMQDSDTAEATTFLVPIPPVMPETLAELLAPYLGQGCIAVGQGWAMFDDPAQADQFAERLGTRKRPAQTEDWATDRPLVKV